MSCGSTRPIRDRRRGFSLTELMVALVISLAFMSGAYMTYFQVVRSQEAAEKRLDALRNGRAALTTVSDELRSINRNFNPGLDDVLFIMRRELLGRGDGIDNDGNGMVDEDLVDGRRLGGAAADDQHAVIGSTRERPLWVGRTDLGDAGVDVDVRYGRSFLIFRTYPAAPTAELLGKTITYAVTEYDGEPNVLVRQTVIEREGVEPLVSAAPLAFGVLGFDVLAWDPNQPPADQYWVDVWDSSAANPAAPLGTTPAALQPPLRLPASLYVRLSLGAEETADERFAGALPVETMTLETIINIEQVIGDARFPRARL